jgi:hypothetical protein
LAPPIFDSPKESTEKNYYYEM